MEISLFKKNSEIYTRFKVKLKEFDTWVWLLAVKYHIDTSKPIKRNSKFIYFEKEGDWING